MKPDTQQSAVRRLARIEGQVRGISKMVQEDKYRIDIVRQVQAVKAALSGLEQVILADHIDTCVDHALSASDLEDRQAKVDELVVVLGGRKK